MRFGFRGSEMSKMIPLPEQARWTTSSLHDEELVDFWMEWYGRGQADSPLRSPKSLDEALAFARERSQSAKPQMRAEVGKKLIGQRVTLENQIRGLAVVFGIRLPRGLSPRFGDEVLRASQGIAGLSGAMQGLLAARKAVLEAVVAIARDTRLPSSSVTSMA